MRVWVVVGVVSCVVALSFFMPPGYQSLHKDHSIILPPLFHRLNPALFPHDDFKFETPFGKNAIFLDMLEIFARTGINIIVLLFLLTVLFRLLFFISIYYLAKYFSGDTFFSLAALFFVFRGSFSDFLSYELVAIATGTAFLALCLDKKNIFAVIMLLLSFMMHPITGIAFLTWYVLFMLLDKELTFTKRLLYIVAGIIPLGIFSVVRGGGVGIFSRFDALTTSVAQATYPNIFISHWPWGGYISFVTWIILGGLLIWRANDFFGDSRKKLVLVTAVIAPVVLTAIAFFGGEVLSIRGIAVLQLFRSLLLVKILLPVVVGYFAYQSLRNNPDRVFENSLFGGIMVWTIFKDNFVFLPEQMLFFIIPLVVLAFGFRYSAFAVFVMGVTLAGWRSYHWHDIGSWYFFLGTYAAGLLGALFVSRQNSIIHRWLPRVVFAGFFFSTVFSFFVLSPVTAVSLRPEIWDDQMWMEMCNWVQKNTEESDVFLIEPFTISQSVGSFRLTCFREPFLIKGEMAGLYDQVVVLEWKRRADLQDALMRDIHTLDMIQKEYRVDYLLSTVPLNLSGSRPMVFSNKEYFLYKIH